MATIGERAALLNFYKDMPSGPLRSILEGMKEELLEQERTVEKTKQAINVVEGILERRS